MKFVRVLLLGLIIIGIGLLSTQKYWVPVLVDKIISLDNKSKVVTPISQGVDKKRVETEANANKVIYSPKISPLASSTKIRVLVNSESALSGTTNVPGIPPSKYAIKIDVVQNQKDSGTALVGDAYLNGKKIARGVPFYSTLEGTSPDFTYYAYRSHSHASAGSSYVGIEIFNQNTGEYIHIMTPPGQDDVSKYVFNSRAEAWYDVLPYIESYAWKDIHSINFVFYYFSWGTGERVSPREVWSYDLIAKQYTLASSVE